MPETTKETNKKAVEKPKTPYFFNRRHLPPASRIHGQNKVVDIYDFDYKDGSLIVVKTGVYNPQEDINACRTETLQELLNKMPGTKPIDKIQAAIASGVARFAEGQNEFDMSDQPTSFVEAQQQLTKAKRAAASLPKELTGRDADFRSILDNMTTDKIMDYMKARFAPKEAPKETKPNE